MGAVSSVTFTLLIRSALLVLTNVLQCHQVLCVRLIWVTTVLIHRRWDTLTAGFMGRSTRKQVTGKHGTQDKNAMAGGICPQDSNTSEWISALQNAQYSSSDKPSSEWKTRVQLESEFGLKQSRMRDVIRDMLRDNIIEHRTFIVFTGNALRHIPHYRLK